MRSSALPSWVFRALLLCVNVVGIWWIHHDMTAASLPGLRVLAALPTRNVDAADRLTLVFDRPLSLPGTPGEASLAASPFAITPQVAGRWFWAAPEKLEYRLEKPLPPGRRFKLAASPSAEQMFGRKLLGLAEFQFETRPLEVNACVITSADAEDVTLEFKFNQPVDPGDLLRHIRLADNGSTPPSDTLQPQVLNQAPDPTLTLRARRPASGRLGVELDEKLAGPGTELPLGKQFVQILEIKSGFAVVDTDVEPASLDSDGSVNIRFTKGLDVNRLRDALKQIQVTPPVPGLRVRGHAWRDDSLTLVGPFECGRRYTARLAADLAAADGETLDTETTVSFGVPDRDPRIALESGGGILSQHGNLLIDLKHVNADAVTLQAHRVHANNLVPHLRREDGDATSRELPAKTVRLAGQRNVPSTAAIDLRKLLGAPLGIYRLRANVSDEYWSSTSTVVAVTDLALTTKQERGGFLVWVTSLSTARPVAGAEIAAITYNNQVIARTTTDNDGIARLDAPRDHPDGSAWVLTAQLGEDLTYIQPQERPWVLDDVDQAGRPSPLTYDVMLYSERGVYRPGEPIHLTGIIRDAAGQVPPPFPLELTVRRPDGNQVAELPISPGTNAQGVFQIDYASPDVGQTGPYRFDVSVPGSAEMLCSTETLVEEYAPQRLEFHATAPPRFGPGQPVDVEANAKYLFGQPGAGLPVRANGTYRRETFRSKRFAEFDFSAPGLPRSESIGEIQAKLDDEGRAAIEVPAPQEKAPDLWRAELNVTVSEEGGRSVTRRVETLVDTADRHVGLRLPGGRVVQAGTPAEVEWVQVTGDDSPAPTKGATYTLCRIDRDTMLQEVDGRYAWKTVEHAVEISRAELSAPESEIGRFQIACPSPGTHRLILTQADNGAGVQIALQCTADPDGSFVAASGEPDRVTLSLDRESYAPGSTATVSIQSPFTGTMLLAVEAERVVATRVVELTEPKMQFELPVDAGLRGGAFVTATVLRRIDPKDQKWLPHRAMGMVRLRTAHADRRLELAIEAPAQVRPGQAVSIRAHTAAPLEGTAPAVIHLWAVDEGILLASDFATPDPFAHFFAPRRSEIASADVFGDLMPDHERPASMARIGGGDDGESYRRRLSPVALPRQAPAVLWRMAVPVAADGSVAAELTMPELTGRLRIMAVAIDGDRYAATESPLVVTTPLLVEMSCPRFAAPDDVIELPIKVFNCTDAELDVSLSLSTSGPLRLDAPPEPSLRVAPGRPVVTWARAVATGTGSVSLVARAEAASPEGESLAGRQQATFGIRPAGPLHSETQIVAIDAGKPYRIPADDRWLPAAAETTVTLGPRPTVQLQSAIDELIDYPYGCVEQTTSRLYVLLHVPELLKLDPQSGSRSDAVAGMIDAGLSRLWSMQTRAGGLGYWPGDAHPCDWGTVYAAEFIAAAQRQGHTVAPAFADPLVKYLNRMLDNGGSGFATLSVEDQKDTAHRNLQAQLCYVLARMDRPQQTWMTRLSERVDDLDTAGKAYLAGAWIELGRKDRAAAILTDEVFSQSASVPKSGPPTSRVHQDSVLLNVLMDLDPRHRLIPPLVQRLEQARSNGHWGTTMENAGAIAALARYQLAGTEPAAFEGVVRQGDIARPFDHAAAHTFTFSGDRPIEINSSGEGRIFVSHTSEGLLAKPVPQEYDRGLIVARKWLNRDGQPVDPSALRVGDLVRVEVSLAAPDLTEGESLDNIAIVDALPGGLEVENPRLSGSESSNDDDGYGGASHVEFRDDRVVIFALALKSERVFRYALRVTTAGSYAVPPIQASCMYDGATASVHGGGRVVIAK